MSRADPLPVLHVHHRPEPGGATGALALLLRELDRERWVPHVLCPGGTAAELLGDAGAIVHTGRPAAFTHIWASDYTGRRWALLGRELARTAPHVARVRSLLRGQRFALVHLNDSPLVPAAWTARRAGVPVVWHLRSALGPEGWRARLGRAAIRALADATIAINDDVARSFGLGGQVIHDSADLARFHPGDPDAARAQLGLPIDRPVVSFFGYLYPAKGYRELLGAAALLAARGVEPTWVLAGGGVRPSAFFARPGGKALATTGLLRDEESAARGLVRSLTLDPHVELVPFVTDPAPWYRASDVVVVPSRGPEIGLPAIEAAASGVPVVATGTVTGAGVVLPGETGVLVPGGGPEELADAIGELLADDARRAALGRAARRHAEQRFDPARNARRVESVYERVLASPPASA